MDEFNLYLFIKMLLFGSAEFSSIFLPTHRVMILTLIGLKPLAVIMLLLVEFMIPLVPRITEKVILSPSSLKTEVEALLSVLRGDLEIQTMNEKGNVSPKYPTQG
jgi:hypothetical protein